MSRILITRWKNVLCAWVLVGLCPTAVYAAQSFTLGHQFPDDSVPGRAARKFAALVSQNSKGAVDIDVQPAARFGDERAHIALVRKQSLDFTITGDVVVSSLSERYLVVNLPFLYRNAAHAMAVYSGPLGKGIRAEFENGGLLPLSWHYTGTRMLTANRPIRNLADIAGLNLRLPLDTAWNVAWRALGAQPRQVPFTDLPLALQLGRVDAQENPPNFIRSAKLYEHQKYLISTDHMPQRQFVFTSTAFWKSLSADRRKLFQDAAKQASAWATETATKEQKLDVAWLTREGGMTLLAFDPAGVQEALKNVPHALGGDEGLSVSRQILATP